LSNCERSSSRKEVVNNCNANLNVVNPLWMSLLLRSCCVCARFCVYVSVFAFVC
jgi:hypothetical protein